MRGATREFCRLSTETSRSSRRMAFPISSHVVVLEVNKAGGREESGKRAHRAELGDYVVHRRSVVPDIVNENNEAFAAVDHLAKGRPRAIRHWVWVLRWHVGPLGDA